MATFKVHQVKENGMVEYRQENGGTATVRFGKTFWKEAGSHPAVIEIYAEGGSDIQDLIGAGKERKAGLSDEDKAAKAAEKEAAKAAKAAEREAAREARKAERDQERAQKDAERAAAREERKAQRDAERAEREAAGETEGVAAEL